MSKHQSIVASHPIVGDFAPVEDLLYHDCPYVFTFRDASGGLALAYLVSSDMQSTRYVGVPIGTAELVDLKAGQRALRSVFTGNAWVITLDKSANIISVLTKPAHELPSTDLPPADMYL
jgi:hypothetical protein